MLANYLAWGSKPLKDSNQTPVSPSLFPTLNTFMHHFVVVVVVFPADGLCVYLQEMSEQVWNWMQCAVAQPVFMQSRSKQAGGAAEPAVCEILWQN